MSCVTQQAIAGLLFLFAMNSHAGDDAHDWLARMSTTLREANYRLSMVVSDGQRIEPVRMTHGVVDGESLSLIRYLNGPPRDVVQIGDSISYFEADGSAYSITNGRVAGPLPTVFSGDIDVLARNYDFVLGGRNRSAGEIVQQVRVTPRDKLRYSGVLWLDVNNAMPLRMDLLNHENELVEQIQVVEVENLETAAPELTSLRALRLPPIVKASEQPAAHGPDRKPLYGWVPPGFQLRYHDRHRLAVLGDMVDYYLLSDGWVDLSIYVQPQPQPPQETVIGGVDGSSGVVTAWQNGVEVAVVGRMPLDTLVQVAMGVFGQGPAVAASEPLPQP